MFSSRIVNHINEIESIAGEWDRLVLQSEFIDIFLTAGFTRAWWKAYGEGKTLCLYVVEDEDGKLRLIAPFYSEDTTPRMLRLVGDFRADYGNIVFTKGDLQSLEYFFSILWEKKDWEMLYIRKVPGHSALLSHFKMACDQESNFKDKLFSWLAIGNYFVYRKWHQEHPRINHESLQNFAGLLGRYSYKRQISWFKKMGEIKYRTYSSRKEVKYYLPKFFELHIKNWEAKEQKSLFLLKQNRNFYEYLVEELEPYQAIRLDLLTLNEKIIGAHFGFTWDRRLYYYKPCYDPSLANHRPGKILLAYMISHAIEEGIEEFDLLKGTEPYKENYASDIRKTGSLKIYRSRLAVAFNALARKLR